MILYLTKIKLRNILLSSSAASLAVTSFTAVYNRNRRQLANKQSSPLLPTMIWSQQSVGQMSNHRNNANYYNTDNKPSIEWLSRRRAHMFDINIEYLGNNYKNNVIVLFGQRYYDNQQLKLIGTGVMFGRLAVTNAHVVQGYQHIEGFTSFSAPTIQLVEQSAVEMSNRSMVRVLYVERHLDLAIIQLYELDYTRFQLQLPFKLANRPLELGESVAIMGHGDYQGWLISVGYITAYTPIDTISATNYEPLSDILDKRELFVVHKSRTIPGHSGSPIVDVNYNIIGIHFGGVLSNDYPKVGTYYQSLIHFLNRGYLYYSQHVRQNRLRQLYESDRPADRRLLGFVLQSEIGGLFTVKSVLPNPAENAHAYVGARIEHVSGQLFRNIDQLTEALNHSLTVQLVLRFDREEEREEEEGDAGHSGQRPRKGSMNHIELTAPDPQTAPTLVDRVIPFVF